MRLICFLFFCGISFLGYSQDKLKIFTYVSELNIHPNDSENEITWIKLFTDTTKVAFFTNTVLIENESYTILKNYSQYVFENINKNVAYYFEAIDSKQKLCSIVFWEKTDSEYHININYDSYILRYAYCYY